MSCFTIALCSLLFVYDSSAVDIMPKLKQNILNFGLAQFLNPETLLLLMTIIKIQIHNKHDAIILCSIMF